MHHSPHPQGVSSPGGDQGAEQNLTVLHGSHWPFRPLTSHVTTQGSTPLPWRAVCCPVRTLFSSPEN